MPSGLQNVVAIMCWMVRSLPSASLILIFFGVSGRFVVCRTVITRPFRCLTLLLAALSTTGSIGSPSHSGSLKCSIGLHEIVDREIVLAVEQPRAAPDDLLELDHGADRPHQHDVADVARIHAGRELLRRGQDRRDGLLVVLERRAATARRARRRRPSPARSSSDRCSSSSG